MSHYNQQPPYGGPPQGYPSQPGYGHSQGPPPPQSHSPFPPNQQAPMYNPNQQQHPPQQQQWGAPPPQQGQWGQQQPPYGQPPQQQQWGQPPPQHQQQQWGQQPPQQQYGQQQQQWGGPQQQQPGGWGAPPQGGYQPPPQQPGYGAQGSNQHYGEPNMPRGADPRSDAIRIHKAIAGIGTDEEELSLTLAAVQQPYQMDGLRSMYDSMYAHETSMTGKKQDFVNAIEGDVSGSYGELCSVLSRPRAEGDAYFVHKAVSRPGTSEDLLNDILLGRTNREIHDMKQAYRHVYRSDMRTDVGNDLSMKTKDLFMLVLDDNRPREEEQAPCIPQNIQRDVADLKSAMRSTIGGLGKDTNAVCAILSRRSNGQLRAIELEYSRVHGKGALEKDIKKKFSGHMEDALLLMLARGIDPLKAEATQLEKSMKGLGTNEALLSNRTVCVHWDKSYLNGVRHAYKQTYNKSLYDRVKGETSGHYEDLLLELLYPGTYPKLKTASKTLQQYRQDGN